jgi:hypothetical protein
VSPRASRRVKVAKPPPARSQNASRRYSWPPNVTHRALVGGVVVGIRGGADLDQPHPARGRDRAQAQVEATAAAGGVADAIGHLHRRADGDADREAFASRLGLEVGFAGRGDGARIGARVGVGEGGGERDERDGDGARHRLRTVACGGLAPRWPAMAGAGRDPAVSSENRTCRTGSWWHAAGLRLARGVQCAGGWWQVGGR